MLALALVLIPVVAAPLRSSMFPVRTTVERLELVLCVDKCLLECPFSVARLREAGGEGEDVERGSLGWWCRVMPVNPTFASGSGNSSGDIPFASGQRLSIHTRSTATGNSCHSVIS
jgi:hypothetical protein